MKLTIRRRILTGLLAASAALAGAPALANPVLVADVATGQVLEADEATVPWYPASLTKLMTTYVVLQAVRNGKIRLDTPLYYSERAQAEPPSKMGFQVGQTVTVDDALKMLMVQSANDIAVALAEGVAGSVEGFVAEMNVTARQIGMTNSNFVNPNGLPVRPGVDLQRTTARDMATLATALIRGFPEQAGLFSLDAIQIGGRTLRNHNGLIGRYPGSDGMKTGYVCSSGFNVVATATRGSRRLVAVVLGSTSPLERSLTAVDAFERGFAATRAVGALSSLPAVAAAFPVDLRDTMCGKGAAKRREAAKKAGPIAHPWRERMEMRTEVRPVIVAATAAPGQAVVAAKPSGLDEDPPAFAPNPPATPSMVPGSTVKPGSATVKSLKAPKTKGAAKKNAKAAKAKTPKTSVDRKTGRTKIVLDPPAAPPNAALAVPGSIYRNAAPASGKSAF